MSGRAPGARPRARRDGRLPKMAASHARSILGPEPGRVRGTPTARQLEILRLGVQSAGPSGHDRSIDGSVAGLVTAAGILTQASATVVCADDPPLAVSVVASAAAIGPTFCSSHVLGRENSNRTWAEPPERSCSSTCCPTISLGSASSPSASPGSDAPRWCRSRSASARKRAHRPLGGRRGRRDRLVPARYEIAALVAVMKGVRSFGVAMRRRSPTSLHLQPG